jgi:hypothetical protein
VRQAILLPFGPSRVLDFGQQGQKRSEFHDNVGSFDSGCLSKSQRFSSLESHAERHFAPGMAFRTHPLTSTSSKEN